MKSIEIFYHLYIPPDWRCCLWSQYLDSHIALIRRSKLWNISQFNLCISMPMYWTEIMGYKITAHSTHQPITFSDKIKEYVSLRYLDIKILEIRDLGQPNLFEGQTLSWIWKKCQSNSCMVLYLHAKGITNYSPVATTDNWRQVLDYFIIEKWDHNHRALETHDIVGIKDKISADFVMSGNFWWARSEYIKNLPDPLNTTCYYPHPENPQRYAYERWITANQPRIFYAADTKTNHYTDYCFLENIQ